MVAVEHDRGDDVQPPGTWMPPVDAAHALGVSDRTMRRYVAAGRFHVQRQDGRVRIFVPEADVSSATAVGSRADRHDLSVGVGAAIEALGHALADERARTMRLEEQMRQIELGRLKLAEQRAELAAQVTCLEKRLHALQGR